jgi:hypothetical protein
MNDRSVTRAWNLGVAAFFVPPVGVAVLVGATLRHRDWNEPFFVYSTYYVLCAMLVVYALVLLSGERDRVSALRAFVASNLPGIAITAVVSAVVVSAVPPGFRVLADEANLVSVSKNLFFSKTANFAVTGKWYFENYWNINQTTDRRPALFPFLVSLIHSVRGYHAENAFHLNAILFVLFVFSSYRLAKRLGGEVFGVATAILVAASPNTLVAVRSGGFDFLAALLLLVVVLSFYDYAKEPSPRSLALLSLHLCLLAHVRVEGLGLLATAAIALLSFRLFRWSQLRGYGFVYSLIPVFLVPRYWQSVAKANDLEQPLSASLFGKSYFMANMGEYLRLATRPLEFDGPHSRLIMIVGAAGLACLVIRLVVGVRAKTLSALHVQMAIFVAALLAMEVVLCFAYMWGKTSQPASARLFIWLDTFLAFAAAWILSKVGARLAAVWTGTSEERRRGGAAGTLLVCGVLFAMYLPIAIEARFINALVLTREAAQTWKFFDTLGDTRILILTNRPGLFTIKNYGALDISIATDSRGCLYELSRHLYRDIYLIQEVDLATKKPLAGFEAWPDVDTEAMLEFQNTESSSVRISRVKP